MKYVIYIFYVFGTSVCPPGLSDVFSSFLTHFLSHHYLHTQNVPHCTVLNAQDNAQIHNIKIHNAKTHKYTMHKYTNTKFFFVWPVSARTKFLQFNDFFLFSRTIPFVIEDISAYRLSSRTWSHLLSCKSD